MQRALRLTSASTFPIHTHLNTGTAQLQHPQAYTLSITTSQILITANTTAGLRHGLSTLAQLFHQFPSHLPTLHIPDEPAFPTRGYMLDISRDRVPTMTHLRELVHHLELCKINQLQLYTEHTFAYPNHEPAWRNCSPITPEEIRTLDGWCQEAGIDLVPNQNCFGHLSHWLKLPEYQHLAEVLGDWMFDVWPKSGPFSLCPTDPASEHFVADLLDQLLPNFTSTLVNIGCDETYDIAYGRSKAACESHGRASVYTDFVLKVMALARKHNRRSLFWGDVALSHPECFARFPNDCIALAWGYEPDAPFDNWCNTLRAAGKEVWVCPGTSNWRAPTSRTTERTGNLNAAAIMGHTGSASGFLLTEWGDLGHWQQHTIALHTLAHGADAAWRGNRSEHYNSRAGALQLLNDPTTALGPWLDALGDADLHLRDACGKLSWAGAKRLRNATALFADFQTAWDGWKDDPADGWAQAAATLDSLSATLPHHADPLLRDELTFTLSLSRLQATRGFLRRTAPHTAAAHLRDPIQSLIRDHSRLWFTRSRSGGLPTSLTRYNTALNT
jgi:hypothetical protein